MTRLNFAGDKLSYTGNINSKSDAFACASFIMNINSGSLNYEGAAKIDSVNIAEGAILQGGTFKLDKEGEAINVPMTITVQPEYDIWAKYSRNKGAINVASDYKKDTYSLGWDKLVGKDWRFGFFGSFAKGKFEADTIYNSLEDYRLGIYGGYNKGPAETLLYADYGWGRNKLNYHYAADPEHRYINYGETDKNKLVLRLNGDMQTAPKWSISGEAGYERGKKGHSYSGEISVKYTW